MSKMNLTLANPYGAMPSQPSCASSMLLLAKSSAVLVDKDNGNVQPSVSGNADPKETLKPKKLNQIHLMSRLFFKAVSF